MHRRALAEIINARAEELDEIIFNEIKRSGYDNLLPAGVVFTGGVSQLSGLGELSRGLLTWPVRIGRPNGLGGSIADLGSPEYATAVGLLLWGLRRGTEPRTTPQADSFKIWERVVQWLRRLLPIQNS